MRDVGVIRSADGPLMQWVQPTIFRALRRYGVLPVNVEDAAQDVMIVLIRRRSRLEALSWSDLRRYSYVVARGIAAKYRRAQRDPMKTATLTETAAEKHVMAHDRSQIVDLLDFLRVTAERFSPLVLEAFILAEIEGHTDVEVAAAQGVPLGTVKTRIRALRSKLRAVQNRGLGASLAR